MGSKGFKITILVCEGFFVLMELLSLIIFMTEDLINKPLYVILLVLGIAGAFLLTLKGDKLPKQAKTVFQFTFLFAMLFRAGEMVYYLGNQSVTIFKILFLNTGEYEVNEKPLGYGVLLLIYLGCLLYDLIFAYKMYDVMRYPEEADKHFLLMQPQYGIALAQFILPAATLMAHIRAEAEMTPMPVGAWWFWLLELVTLIIWLLVLLYQKAHPKPEPVVGERNSNRKKKYRNSGKPKKSNASKPAYRRKK